MSRKQLVMIAAVLGTFACGKTSKPGEGGEPAASSSSSTPASAPSADDFCEYTVDGGAPDRGGGGFDNVQSIFWMRESQRGMGTQLLINCGARAQVSLSSPPKAIPIEMGAKKFAISTGGGGDFSVLGPGFTGGTGELDLTAWDTTHIAGTFSFEAKGKQYAGSFDLKCPQPGNGVCP